MSKNPYFYTFGPIVAEHDIKMAIILAILFRFLLFHCAYSSKKLHAKGVHLFGVVCCYSFFTSQRVAFNSCAVLEIRVIVNSWAACDSKLLLAFSDEYRASLTKKINARGEPASKMRLPQWVYSLVVASNEDGEESSLFLSIIVVLKCSHLFVFFRTVHIIEVGLMSDRLEISTNDQKVNLFC